MKQFQSIILLTVCIGLVYGMVAVFLEPQLLSENEPLVFVPKVEQVAVRQHLPVAVPSAVEEEQPRYVATPTYLPLLAMPAPVAATSSAVTRSLAGGTADYAMPGINITAYSNQIVTPVYAYATAPQRSSGVASGVAPQNTVQSISRRKTPGTIGGNAGAWQGWLDDYYGDTGLPDGDLSGLNKWWNENIGGGTVPGDAYDKFYDWAKGKYTPLPDGTLLLLCLLLVYGFFLYKRMDNLKKYV